MKKILFLLLSVSLFSCSNDSELENSNASKEKISEVMIESNLSIQKMKYNMLSKEDKFLLWNNKVQFLIDDSKLNNEQKSLLIDLKNHLNTTVFDDGKNNDEKEVFKTIYAKEFLKKANVLFSEEYIITNFYYITYKTDAGFEGGGGDGPSSCNCSSGSVVTCLSTIQNPLFCKKSQSNCKITKSNCGWLLRYDCDGMCLSVHDM